MHPVALPAFAAIPAVDVVDYSRLMGEDEAGTTRVHREAARAITFNATDRFPPKD